MSQLGYNISEFARMIVGAIPIRYGDASTTPNRGGRIDYSDVQVVPATEFVRLSALGTPVIFPITFKGGEYQYYNRRGEVVTRQMRDFALPASCIAQFRRSKIKEKTRVVASQSSVKEIYGHDDWSITITGVFFDDDAHPQGLTDWRDQKNTLLEWEELADSVEVEGDLFADLNIFKIDINDIQMAQTYGRDRVMAFQIQCESDDPRDLFDL